MRKRLGIAVQKRIIGTHAGSKTREKKLAVLNKLIK